MLITICLTSCKHKADPEAVKLNNMAADSSADPAKAIDILNRAIKFDPDYFTAYSNKFTFQYQLHLYNDALLTGKQMMRLKPDDARVQVKVGEVYEKSGDPDAATACFAKGLTLYNHLLDTMSISNGQHKNLEFEKAIDLILLHRENQGYSIISGLYEREMNPTYKEGFAQSMHITREQILNGKVEPSASQASISN